MAPQTISLLWAMVCVSVYTRANRVVAPIHEPQNWKPATVDDFTCRTGFNLDFDSKFIKTKALVLKRVGQAKVKGYLCMKNRWTTTCETNWLYSKSVSHHITHVAVSAEECYNKIRDDASGNLKIESYPNPQCAWSSTVSREEDFIHISTSDVGYDMYTDTVLSPSFPGGTCKLKTCCKTIYPNIVWVPETPAQTQVRDALFDETMVTVTVEAKKVVKDSWVTGATITPSVMEGSCKKTLGSKSGILLPNGQWFSIVETGQITIQPKGSVEEKETWVNLINDLNLSDCAETQEAKVPTAEFTVYKTESMVFNILNYHLCLETVAKARSGKNLTRLDLARLAPEIPGVAHVYQLTSDGVRVGSTRYEIIAWKPTMGLDKTLGLTIVPSGNRNSETIKWIEWTRTDDGLLNGPNGIFIADGKEIVHPNLKMVSFELETYLISEHSTQLVPHPVIHSISDEIYPENYTIGGKNSYIKIHTPTAYFWSGIHWIEGAVQKLFIVVVATALIGLFILVVWLCCGCCSKSRPVRNQKWE
ncbi:glycoprotein [Tupaia virus]|uniref:Glycoprotein n=1 Tax=Tupaia virus (isolate Tupaia/Thailand/-/1986) TaxID=1560034 RepID=GLYCO_TUPVT|nr:glycoprotein [Tupaia virus]Q4VKV3.1 RecName: Full=Glycoprotein; Flags: Precursor [Tupaia virus isolate Tupaia/Thailand/-/1986]AAX47601.1 glycoprotein [Tupaia virus]